MIQTPEERLAFIYEMIEGAKSNLRAGGFYYQLWGWLVVVGSLANYFLLMAQAFQWIPWIWLALMGSGSIVTFTRMYRGARQARVWTHFDSLVYYLWIGFFISMVILFSMAMFRKISFEVAVPVGILFYGLATFVSGGVLRFKPLIVGGIACWLLSLITFFLPHPHQYLALALAIGASFLIPGYLLKQKT